MINAVVSFRSVPRIFHQLLAFTPILAFKVPCHNSVINWTLRYGHHLLSTVSKLAEDWFAVVDMSIETGLGKALVVLRVPFAKWNVKADQALTLADCECISVDVREDWNSEHVKTSLEELFGKTGKPAFIVKDKGSDITKGVRMLEIPDVSDIGHELANGLKDRFSRDKWFAAFLTLIAACGASLRQTRLAFLTPPKIRTKGRFQSIARLAEWAVRVMDYFEADVDGKKYPAFSMLVIKLEKLKAPIARLARTCVTVNDILSILKKRGLCTESAIAVHQLMAKMHASCPIRRRLASWLDRHLLLLTTIRQTHPTLTALPVSSDVIESLFGRFKHILSRQPRPQLNHLTAMIATLCGTPTSEDIKQALVKTRTHELEVMRGGHFPGSIEVKRREFIRKTEESLKAAMQKPGTARKAD